MHPRLPSILCPCLALLGALVARAQDPRPSPGHSVHGEAFDEGPRQQAVLLEGMGSVHFPVTAKSAGAQAFFDQGVGQLHTFYFFEAERSFRQTALLDPDCAMAYWGMAMANENNGGRARGFLGKAARRAGGATERERKYIEALAAYHREGRSDADRRADYLRGLEAIVLEHPDDIEAKAFLAWTVIRNSWAGEKLSSHVAVHVLIEEVLRKSPMHPGAHHYRIHLWDHRDPAQALASADAYGKTAPGIAHAWHMPGHIFNGVSIWPRAVWQQTASSRVDHAHMLAHAILPFQIHNYAHNQHYLIANLSHMGGLRAAAAFSKNLIESPRDPGNDGAQRLGRFSLMRVLVRFERWDEVLESPYLEWSKDPDEQAWSAYSRGLACHGKGDLAGASGAADSLDKLAAEAGKNPGHGADRIETARLELRGRLKVTQGSLIDGFDLLDRGAKMQLDKFKGDLDGYPRPCRESCGLAHLEARNWGLAEASFRAVLEDRKHNVVSLAGLVEALQRGGKAQEAAAAHAEFLAAWRHADQDLPFAARLAALDVVRPAAAGGEAREEPVQLASDKEPRGPLPPGPDLWTPAAAPDFELEDVRPAANGGKVRLSSFRGKNVVLVFYLGSDCAPCVEQLTALGKEKDAFEALDVLVLAITDDAPEKTRDLLQGPKGAGLPFPILHDPERRTAKLYNAHDTFEDLALHGLVFIDREGGIRWLRAGAAPFMDLAFLKGEIERVEKLVRARRPTRARL